MFKFPYTNLHELNLDWILEKVKTLVANNEEFNDKADYAVETADEAKTIAEQAAQATIADGAVTTNKIANGAVTGNKIAQATIQTGNLSAGCVTNPYILDGAVSYIKLSEDAKNTNTSSYFKTPDGFLIQWGMVAIDRQSGNNTARVDFDQVYQNAPIVFTTYSTVEANRFLTNAAGISASGFTVNFYNTGTAVSSQSNVRWIAFGT